jgi:ABC-type transport system substrate-binding protein
MKPTLKKWLPLSVVAIVGIAGLSGCQRSSDSSGEDSGSASSGAQVNPLDYTYFDSMTTSPSKWSPHTWQSNDEQVIQAYTEMGFYDFVLNDAKNGYDIVPEMASALPVDSTASLSAAEASQYGLKTQADGSLYTSGQKWVIDLNKGAKWEDGTVINADSYIYSMQQMLNPVMQNYRASGWYAGSLAIGNAQGYSKSGQTVYSPYLIDDSGNVLKDTPADDAWYMNMFTVLPFWAKYSIAGLIEDATITEAPLATALLQDTNTWGTEASPKNVRIDNDSALLAKVVAAMSELMTYEFGVGITDSFDISTVTSSSYPACALCCRKVSYPVVDWANVGLVKTGDYQLTMYIVNPLSPFEFKYNVSSPFLVKEDIYEAAKKTVGSLVTSSYGTSVDTYASYGPYKLDKFQLDKSFHMIRNDQWYGYTDGQHNGQFTIGNIDVQIVPQHETQLQMFLKGQLDGIELTDADFGTYKSSQQALFTPETYTYNIYMDGDYSTLKATQDSANDGNHTILENKKFRQALSLAIDRQTLAQSATAGGKGWDVLINNLYISDVDKGTRYRDTDQAKQVVKDVYGTDADGNPNYNGFDLTNARKLLNEALDEENAKAVASPDKGYYKSGDAVTMLWQIYTSDSWGGRVNAIKSMWTTLVAGTALEGKFNIKTEEVGNVVLDNVKAGKSNIGGGAWGGSELDPFSIPQCYVDPDFRTQHSIDTGEEVTITKADGTKVTKTLADWDTALRSGDFTSSEQTNADRVTALAAVEEALIKGYNFAPIYARYSVTLDSFRVVEATTTYIAVVGYGGIRKQSMKLSDSDWSAYVAKQGGTLDYTK